MKKLTLSYSLFVCALIFSPGIVLCDGGLGAESIVLAGGNLGSITFPHGRHQGTFVDCKPCHELFAEESMIIEKMKAAGEIKKKAVMDMCKNCHKKMIDKGEKTGPTSCRDCHKK